MSIAQNIETIYSKIEKACEQRSADNGHVKLVAVSKYHTIEEVKTAYAAGQRVFGENRVQELLPKIDAMSEFEDVEWHLIGHLQKNKVRQVVGKVSLIQSVDSIGLLEEIEKRAAQHNCNVDILLQVNIANEEQKSGISFEDIDSFLEAMPSMDHVFLKGLMFIAPNLEDKNELRPYFKKLNDKFHEIKNNENDHVEMKWLSMGMSGDYECAVSEGANMIRVGSAVFSS